MSRLLRLAGLGLVAVVALWILPEVVAMVLGFVWWIANVIVSLAVLALLAYLAYLAYDRFYRRSGSGRSRSQSRSREDDRERIFE